MKSSTLSAKSSAKDVFSYLLMIIVLAISVIFFTTLLWQYINVQFPDPLAFYYTGAANLMRNAISALLIAWPVLLLTTWMINRDLAKEKVKENIWIRKWLVYLTLFLAAITIIVDAIVLVNSFLAGELTTRFLLKLLVILVVAISVFGFYLWELRRDVSKKTSVHRVVGLIGTLIIGGWIVAGFLVIGSPSHQRDIRFDEQRTYNLQSLSSEINYHVNQYDTLPTSMEDLGAVYTDPETGEPYTYRVLSENTYELCATFTTDNTQANTSGRPSYPESKQPDFWTHSAGEVCFTAETIDNDAPSIFR